MRKLKSKNITILVVDDEVDLRNALASSFERKGYNVLTASNGTDAYKIIETHNVNVVVSDIRMPNGNGIQLLEQTKSRHPSTPIILLITGFSEITTEEAHEKGAEALFSKPFSLKMLEEAIERLLQPPATRWSKISKRSEPKVEISVQLKFCNLETALESKAVSIGRGGMFITLSKNDVFFNINDEVSFEICFEGNEKPLEGSGIIRWIRTQDAKDFPRGVGVEFTYVGESERKKIIEHVDFKKLKKFIPRF